MKMWKTTPGVTEFEPELEYYKAKNRKYDGAVVIFPGGGYAMRADHEGKGYAEFLNENGIDAFVCQYRVSPDRFPYPLLDARRAVRYVRYHAKEYGINPEKIGVMGSSAGGNLAALVSTYREKIEHENIDEIDNADYLPSFQILCYPVITLSDLSYAHVGSAMNLMGENMRLAKELSPELIADEKTPKAFIWHTFADDCVPVLNSLEYAKTLKNINVPCELHIFPEGRHGLGLASEEPHTAQWSNLLLKWLDEFCF